MANRQFSAQGTLLKSIRYLYPVVSVGGAGAVTLKKRSFRAVGTVNSANSTLIDAPTSGLPYAFGDGAGTRSVARTGTGAWTITLTDPYQFLMGVRVIQTSNTTGASTSGLSVGVVSGSTNVATNTAVGNGGVIAIVLSSATVTAADPASGDTLTLEITLCDATEP
jgi:hypothetical protein